MVQTTVLPVLTVFRTVRMTMAAARASKPEVGCSKAGGVSMPGKQMLPAIGLNDAFCYLTVRTWPMGASGKCSLVCVLHVLSNVQHSNSVTQHGRQATSTSSMNMIDGLAQSSTAMVLQHRGKVSPSCAWVTQMLRTTTPGQHHTQHLALLHSQPTDPRQADKGVPQRVQLHELQHLAWEREISFVASF